MLKRNKKQLNKKNTNTFENIVAILFVAHEQKHLPARLRAQQVDLENRNINISK